MNISNTCFQGHRNCVLISDHLDFISINTVSDWRRILLYLGIEQNIINRVEEDGNLRNYDSREVAYQGYLKWKNIDPYKACFCIIQQALSRAQRNDVTKSLKEKYNFHARRSIRHNSFTFPIENFVGREKEVEQIMRFIDDSNAKKKLMVLCGMPCVGKSALVHHAVNKLVQNQPDVDVIRPLFISKKGETSWGLEDIAVNILEEIHPDQEYISYRVAALHKILISLEKPMLLVLELCGVEIKKNTVTGFSLFLSSLLHASNQHLKIILTAYKAADILNPRHEISYEEMQLQGLSQPEALKVLRAINPRMTNMNCKRLYDKCGGHPYILRKIGAHVKNFHSNEKELESFLKELGSPKHLDVLHPMIAPPTIKHDMKLVFDELEDVEKKTLVQLCGFPEIIPVDALEHIFTSSVYHTCNHLCINHCIIEKSSSGTYFKMNLLTRSCIKDFAQSDPALNQVLTEAKIEINKYYLNLIKSLDEIFIFPCKLEKKSNCFNLVSDYQEKCTFCPKDCSCPTIKIVKYLFRIRKTLIMRAIQQGLSSDIQFHETVEIALKVVHFLRFVMSKGDLLEMYDEIFNICKKRGEKLLMAMAVANLVFVKAYYHVREGVEENIHYLTKAINVLDGSQMYLYGVTYTLIYCYMKRGHLYTFTSCNQKECLTDFNRAEMLINKFLSEKERQLFLMVLSGYCSAFHYSTKDFHKSIEVRKTQLIGYQKHFGVHTHCARALHYQSHACGKVADYGSAIKCARVAYGIYHKLYGDGVETMKVLSTLGKMYIKNGQIEKGFQKLDHAKNVAENALGEHEKVARCYEQLAVVKKSHGFSLEADELELRAKAIRTNFERKSSINMKKYSLQLSKDHLGHDIYALSSDEVPKKDHYTQVVFLTMFIAIIWRCFEIYYTCNCDRFSF
ncbi:uncharacterized protein [Clytia hemisphaerica]|uniref:Death domain-containing protein n=1 Tax=Clytia hemisphaerica TaxID=252671 RepID=A0A7M5UIG2_9CNID